jgi:hypothetical protein
VEININYFTILIHGPPEIMLLAVDLLVRHTGEDLINVEGVAVASVLSLQPAGVNRTKLDAPEADRFAADSDPSLSEQILDVSVTQIEAMVQPHGIADDFGRESVTLISIHHRILPIFAI